MPRSDSAHGKRAMDRVAHEIKLSSPAGYIMLRLTRSV
jgi:hypothetical protein